MVTQNNIQDFRRRRHMSQQALAVLAGTSPAIITLVEKHGHLPGEDLRKRIAEALSVTEAELWPNVSEAASK